MKTFSWISSVGLTCFYFNVAKICIKIRLGINSLVLSEPKNKTHISIRYTNLGLI